MSQKELSRTEKLKNAFKSQAKKLQARWRKVVTGNSNKRVRDHVKEVENSPKSVKLLDKVGFTLGVLNLLVCQYFLLNKPQYFPIWYAIVLPTILISRFFHFKSLNFHYFMIDFCYFTVWNTLINLSILNTSQRFFKVCFLFSTGVLPVAIPIWRNSLIFHDFDKIVSVYIHLLPCMLYYTLRWRESQGACTASFSETIDCSPLAWSDYGWAMLVYVLWQVAYLIKTEVLDKSKFDSHPEIITSLRWMAKDTKNEFAQLVLGIARKLSIFGRNEGFDSTSLKTKLVFVFCQMLLTVVSFAPTPFVYHSQEAHLLWIIIILTISIFNGGSFYIEVFSVRYQEQLKKLGEVQKIARDATAMMNKMASEIGTSHTVYPIDKVADSTLSVSKGEEGNIPTSNGDNILDDSQERNITGKCSSERAQRLDAVDAATSSSEGDDNDVLLSDDESTAAMIQTINAMDNDLLLPE